MPPLVFVHGKSFGFHDGSKQIPGSPLLGCPAAIFGVGAFGKIVTSMVNDVIMPPIGILLGGVDFADLAITLKAATEITATETTAAVTLNYGKFIQTVVDFLIVAGSVFVLIKAINTLRRKQEREEAKK